MTRGFRNSGGNVLELTVSLKHADSFMPVYGLTKLITLEMDGNYCRMSVNSRYS
jgi:hypothetical protein